MKKNIVNLARMLVYTNIVQIMVSEHPTGHIQKIYENALTLLEKKRIS